MYTLDKLYSIYYLLKYNIFYYIYLQKLIKHHVIFLNHLENAKYFINFVKFYV